MSACESNEFLRVEYEAYKKFVNFGQFLLVDLKLIKSREKFL